MVALPASARPNVPAMGIAPEKVRGIPTPAAAVWFRTPGDGRRRTGDGKTLGRLISRGEETPPEGSTFLPVARRPSPAAGYLGNVVTGSICARISPFGFASVCTFT